MSGHEAPFEKGGILNRMTDLSCRAVASLTVDEIQAKGK